MYQSGFDYSLLDQETAFIAQQIAARIRQRNVSMAQQFIDNGKDLLAVKERLPRGQWLPWIRDEFNWPESTATNMMKIARIFGHISIAESSVTAAALQLLSQYDIPETIRQTAGELIESGMLNTRDDAIHLIRQQDAELAQKHYETKSSGKDKVRREVVNNLALHVAELGFAVRNMQVALASSYGVPLRSDVADALQRLQGISDALIPLVPGKLAQTRSQQGIRRLGNTSGYVGVTRNQHGGWNAQITVDKRNTYLGRFDTSEEAARAYDAKARELYGDTARLNFPA